MEEKSTARACESTPGTIKVVVAEDERLLADALPELLHAASDGRIEVVRTCSTRADLFRTVRQLSPDVLLCDVRMPRAEGDPPTPCNLAAWEALRRQTDAAVILLSGNPDVGLMQELLLAGAAGFLDKGVSPQEICWAIERVDKGGRYVPPRLQAAIDLLEEVSQESVRQQLLKGRRGDVLRLLLEGYSQGEIAESLHVGKKHVDKKVVEVKAILGVKTHIRIYLSCVARGIIKG